MPDALDQFDDDTLLAALEARGLHRSFGLVFEDSVEEIDLVGKRPARGDRVQFRGRITDTDRHVVTSVKSGVAQLRDVATGEAGEAALDDLLVTVDAGDVVYPGLKPSGSVGEASERPSHVAIKGDNLHVLRALRYSHAGAVDAIYIDPPYNTGNGDWVYNDRYSSRDDAYRHSKWLAFMKRRLLLAHDLLADTGVIIVAIGDDEHHRLRMLMDDVFGEQNFISDVVWQGGRKNDSRYVSNGADYMLIYARDESALSETGVRWREKKPGVDEVLEAAAEAFDEAIFDAIDLLMERAGHPGSSRDEWSESRSSDRITAVPGCFKQPVEWLDFLKSKRGSGDPESVALDRDVTQIATKRMKAWWKGLSAGDPRLASKHYNHIDERGRLFFPDNLSWPGGGGPMYDITHPNPSLGFVKKPSRGWRSSQERMNELIAEGRIHFGVTADTVPNYKRFLAEVSDSVSTSVFDSDRRASAQHLAAVLGDKRFPFPKDHTVLMRWLRMVAPDDAVILDFFGGSGSTLEAVMRLNDEDGGNRQCIIATSNEVGPSQAKSFARAGVMPHDEAWERAGVFENVLRPRITTLATGQRPDGSPLADKLKLTNPERHHVAFFDLTWLPGNSVRLQRRFADLEPLLWMRAGGHGAVLDRRRHAVLFDVADLEDFASTLSEEVTMVFVVTDSYAQFDLARRRLERDGLEIVRLPVDYLGAMQ